MQELFEQLQERQDKGFIRPSHSLWEHLSPFRLSSAKSAQSRYSKDYLWDAEMEDRDMTMEEYVQYETEKVLRNVNDDALISELEFSSEPTVSPRHVAEVNWKIKTSLSKSNDEKYEIIYDNDLFSYKIFPVNDSKSDTEHDVITIKYQKSFGDISIEPLGFNTAYPVTWIRRIDFLCSFRNILKHDG
ncbi:hypothetical protein Tco_0268686 [Tanacetum coccineum]